MHNNILKNSPIFFLSFFMAVSVFNIKPATADDNGVAAMLHTLKKERSKICQDGHFHTTSGKGKTKRQALKAARRGWMSFTAFEYGADWGSYQKSAHKGERCFREEGHIRCNVSASPCKRR